MNEQLISDLVVETQRHMTGSGSREFVQKFTELIVKECGVALSVDGLKNILELNNGYR